MTDNIQNQVVVVPPIKKDVRSSFRSPEEVEVLRQKYLKEMGWGGGTR